MSDNDHLTIGGADKRQPVLRVPTEVYSRVVGYIRPLQSWHPAKQQEHRDRVPFTAPKGEADG
jgi:ribonucleoside-triphosphate reductase (formate)